MSELRERIARALWDHGERESQKWLPGGPLVAWEEVPADDSYRRSTLAQADAVIAALGGLREVSGPQYACDRLYGGCPARQVTGRCEHVEYVRKYVLETPWERIGEDG